MEKKDLKSGIEQIDAIYAEYKTKLGNLRAERQAVISSFIRKIEDAKKEELRKIISGK